MIDLENAHIFLEGSELAISILRAIPVELRLLINSLLLQLLAVLLKQDARALHPSLCVLVFVRIGHS